MKLGDCNWWPKTWNTNFQNTANGQDVPRDEIRQDGILETCEITNIGLKIGIDCRGKEVFGRVAQSSLNSPGNLNKLRTFLLDHAGESMATIENLDVEPDQFNH